MIARTSVTPYKRGGKRLEQIGQDLSVAYAIESSLQQSANRLRVSVRLIQVGDQRDVWVSDFDYGPQDAFRIEDSVAGAVARAVQLSVNPAERGRMTEAGSGDPMAVDEVMRGRDLYRYADSKTDWASARRYLVDAMAAGAGAVAALVRSVGGADYRLPHTGETFYDPALPKIPAAGVSAEDVDLIAGLAAQGPVQMHLTLTPQTLPKVESYNVIADWPGATHPEQVVIVSGHLDSWDLGTGAIDDGAGVAMAMQALHLMQKFGLHPARTIRFVAWMSEEPGLDGAATYVADHATELAGYVGAIESDFGCDHPSGVTFAGSPALSDWLSPVAHELEAVGASVLLPGPDVGEDIAAIVGKGVPGFTPTQDSRYYFNYHHTAADTFDKVNPRHLAENAAVMAVIAYALAATDAPVPRVGSMP